MASPVANKVSTRKARNGCCALSKHASREDERENAVPRSVDRHVRSTPPGLAFGAAFENERKSPSRLAGAATRATPSVCLDSGWSYVT